MSFSPQLKVPGDLIRSNDWNEAMSEIVRLELSKLNLTGGTISGQLLVGSNIAPGGQIPALRVMHNGNFAWGNSLSIDQTAPGNNDGPKIRFQKTMQGVAQPKSWSAGILNGPTQGHFVINEDTGTGFGTNRLTVAPGGNVGIGTTNPQEQFQIGDRWTFHNGGARVIGMNTRWDGTNDVRIVNGGAGQIRFGGDGSLIIRNIGNGNAGVVANGNDVVFSNGNIQTSGNVQTGRLGLGNNTDLFKGEVGFVAVLPGQTPPNILNLSMASNPGTSAYTFRVGHTVTINNGFLFNTSFVSRLRVNQNGQVNAAGPISPNSADYAELFESENKKEIPIGTAVVIGKNGTVRPAKKEEQPIGIVTKTPGILGNNPQEWPKQYLRDEYGNVEMKIQDMEVPVSDEAEKELRNLANSNKKLTAAEKKRLVKKEKHLAPVLNPDFDSEMPYTPRDQRPEWQIVGLLGQLHVTKGQPVASNWIKLRDVSDKVELWLVK